MHTIPILVWSAHTRRWHLYLDGEMLSVDEATYHDVFVEQLAKRGIEWKTWTQYMRPAEEAWNHQCRIERMLQTNIELWRSVEGVKVESRHR